MPFKQTHQAYSNLTGYLPYKSTRGHEYILIVYDYDSNAILAEHLKNKQAASITKAWEKLHTKILTQGIAPKFYLLDNEISGEFRRS